MAAASPVNNNNANPREWHVYYSKSKQREYYFDPVSQESTWVLPANASRVTDVRNQEGKAFWTFRKLFLLSPILIVGIWLCTRSFPLAHVEQQQNNSNQSASSTHIIINQAAAGKDSDESSNALSSDQFPNSWKKVLEKEIPHDQELDRIAKNIEAALQSSEDLLKKIVADAKEAGMEIKSSAFTH